MGIPRKKVETGFLPKFKSVILSIPDLPKGKLIRLTCGLMFGLYGTYYMMSDYRKYINRNLQVRQIEKIRQSVSVTEIQPASCSKPFSDDYGLDFDKKK